MANLGLSGRGKFLEIDNIHVMRSSLDSLIEACATAEPPRQGAATAVDYAAYRPTPELESRIEKSRWLHHVQQVLVGTDGVVDKVHDNSDFIYLFIYLFLERGFFSHHFGLHHIRHGRRCGGRRGARKSPPKMGLFKELRRLKLYSTPHAPYAMIYLIPMLILC